MRAKACPTRARTLRWEGLCSSFHACSSPWPRLAHLPPDTRPLPSVTPYDQLLRRAATAAVTTVREKHSDDPSRQRGLTEQAADAAIDSACRILRLPSIHMEFSDIAEQALKEQMSYWGFLTELLMAECDDRGRRRSERRTKAVAGVRLRRRPNIDAATVHTLASCE